MQAPVKFRAARSIAYVNVLFCFVVGFGAVLSSSILVLIAAYILGESIPLLVQINPSRFFTDEGWFPLSAQYNITPMLVASLALTVGALLIAAPAGVIVAVFCVYYAGRKLSNTVLRLIELTAVVPTVIFGFWGLTVLVPMINRIAPPGTSLLAGILILSMMILPSMALICHTALTAVPNDYLLAGTALGIKRSTLIWSVILPTARFGILSAMILGGARAIGETMVVLMVCGNIVQLPSSIVDPIRALTANIALEMPYAMGNHRTSLFVTGLMVLILVSSIVLFCELMNRRNERR